MPSSNTISIVTKPKKFKAVQFTGKNFKQIKNFCKKWKGHDLDFNEFAIQVRIMSEGYYKTHFSYLDVGDFIAKYPKEESFFYIRKDDFDDEYKKVGTKNI